MPLSYPAGTILTGNVDFSVGEDYSVKVLDPTTGNVTDTIVPPVIAGASLFGEWVRLDSGEWMATQTYLGSPSNLQFFSDDFLTRLGSATLNQGSNAAEPGAAYVPGSGGSVFFVTKNGGVSTYDTTGAQVSTWSTGNAKRDRLAISPDGTTAYHWQSGQSNLYVTVLGGSTSLLVDISGATFDYFNAQHRGLMCLANGNIVTSAIDGNDGTPKLKCYTPAGALVWATNTLAAPPTLNGYIEDFCPGQTDASIFVVTRDQFAVTLYFADIDVTTGALTPRFTKADDGTDPSPIYNNGPYWILRGAAVAPPSCSGGGAIEVDADPADGPAFSGRVLSPRAWLELGFDDADRSLALDSYNHPDGRRIGNLIRFGSIRRGLSTHSQPYKMGEADVTVDDSSRLMDTLEATTASTYWANREGRIRLSITTAIAAAATAWTLFRGIWRTNDSDGLQRNLGFTSVLGSEFSDFNLERQIADLTIKDVFDGAPKDSQDKTLPIAYGIYPDPAMKGTGDPVANVVVTAAARPAAPTNFTATAVTDAAGDGDDGTVEYYAVTALVGGLESEPAYASVSLSGGNNAADLAWDAYPGASQINVYSAVRSDFLQFAQLATPLAAGATSMRDLSVLPNQDVEPLAASGGVWILGLRMNVTWYVYAQFADGTFSAPGVSSLLVFTPIRRDFRRRDMTVTWDAYTDAVKYFAVRHVSLYSNWSPRNDLQLIAIPPVTSVSDINNDDALIEGGYGDAPGIETPDKPTGTIPAIPCGKETIDGISYNRLVISIGAWRHVDEIYVARATSGTDTAASTSQETQYDLVPESDYGSTWLAPGKTGWVDPLYRVYNGVWCTVIFTTLDPLPTTVLVNGCGLTDVSDGTGSTIDGAARIFFHLLQNFVLPPADEAWTSGDWLAPRTFADSTPVINTASLDALETIETSRIGRYYRGQVYIDTAMSLRDFLGHTFTSWNIRVGENEHGQVIGKHLDEFTVLSSTLLLTDRADLVGPTKINRRIEELENYITYDFGYRPAVTGQFRKQNQVQSDATAIAANRGHRSIGDHRPMRFVDDPTTAADVIGRDLTLNKYVPTYVTVPITLPALLGSQPVKLGDIIRVTDVEGIGATGWTARPLWVLDIEETLNDLTSPPDLTLICLDVKRVLEGSGEMWDQATAVDYGSATTVQQGTYMFMANETTGLLPGGAAAKEMR